jgi:hypothetical protein
MFDCAIIGGGVVGLATAMTLGVGSLTLSLSFWKRSLTWHCTRLGAIAVSFIRGSITSQAVSRRDSRGKEGQLFSIFPLASLARNPNVERARAKLAKTFSSRNRMSQVGFSACQPFRISTRVLRLLSTKPEPKKSPRAKPAKNANNSWMDENSVAACGINSALEIHKVNSLKGSIERLVNDLQELTL